jgi:hypothetical protein
MSHKRKLGILKHDVSRFYRESRTSPKNKLRKIVFTDECASAVRAASSATGIPQSTLMVWAVEELLCAMGYLKQSERRTAADAVKGITSTVRGFEYHNRLSRDAAMR